MSKRPPASRAGAQTAAGKRATGRGAASMTQGNAGTKPINLSNWFMLAAFMVGLDQITKWWVLKYMELGDVIEVTSYFNLVYVMNPGAAFSFLADAPGWQRYFLSGVAIVASIVIPFMMRTSRDKPFVLLCLSGILAGAIGNLIDRLRFGTVVDFLDVYYAYYHWPAFNVADMCISGGAIGLIAAELFILKNSAKDKK